METKRPRFNCWYPGSNHEAFASTGCSWCSSTLCASFIHWNNNVRWPRFANNHNKIHYSRLLLTLKRSTKTHNSPNILSENSTPLSRKIPPLEPLSLDSPILEVGVFLVSSSSFLFAKRMSLGGPCCGKRSEHLIEMVQILSSFVHLRSGGPHWGGSCMGRKGAKNQLFFDIGILFQ